MSACWWCLDPLDCSYCIACHRCEGLCAEAAAVEREIGDPDGARWLS